MRGMLFILTLTLARPALARADASAPLLDASPSFDLVASHALWHLYDPFLLIPVASEGFHKYSGEYKSPWGAVLEVEDRPGRVLAGRQANLSFPAQAAGPLIVRLRIFTTSRKQRVLVDMNGQSLGAVTLEPGWHIVDLPRPGNAALGENELTLRAGARETIAGERTHALWHSIELIPQASAKSASTWPALSPHGTLTASGKQRPALQGFERMAMFIEVPESGWLRVSTHTQEQGARFAIRARRIDKGEPVLLLDRDQAPETLAEHHVPLAGLAGELVRIELSIREGGRGNDRGSSHAAWIEPRIQLAKARRAAFEPMHSLILIVVDTLRADRLSLYGKTRVKTPNLDRAAAQGSAVFLHNQAASPSSPPSHASIQTGTIPRVHGVGGDDAELRPDTPMLSAVLGKAGMVTAYVGNNNFAMGRLKSAGRWSWFHEPVFNNQGMDCAPLIQAVLRFVDEHKSRRFFVSALPLEPHVPYDFHEGITENYFPGPYDKPIGKQPGSAVISRITSRRITMNDTRWQQIQALYDGEVEYLDRCIGTLLRGVEERGLADKVGLVITSDHGEGMFEHEHMGHAYGHYAELANVPLVVIWPRGHALAGAVRTLDMVTSHIDIAPTVLDLMGVPVDERMQGRSLLPAILRKGPALPRVLPMEYGRSYALRARSWKYIVDYSGEELLYDVAHDPREQRNVKDTAPLALRYMRDMAGLYLAHRTSWRIAGWGDLNRHEPGFARKATRKAP